MHDMVAAKSPATSRPTVPTGMTLRVNTRYTESVALPPRSAYAATMFERFTAGRSPADFSPEDHEIDFAERATVDDLDTLGRAQFGLDPIVHT